VAAEVLHDHQVAWLKGGSQHFLDIGSKAFAVDGTVEDLGRLDAVVAKRGDEGHGFPVAVGNFGDEPFAA
jgi:hypothetical protein